ncbi:MAG: hypothetical protein EBT64_07935, partial [Gammaproteobacteria bacterium]|nr:hypothetical protein [Gammaproteobacteria bacterium]
MRQSVILISAFFAAAVSAANPGVDRNAERIAVLVTDWAEPQGIDPLYRREVIKRSFGANAAG